MPELERQLEAVAAAREQSRLAEEELYRVRLRLESVRARLRRTARDSSDAAVARDDRGLEAEEERLTATEKRLREDHDTLAGSLHRLVGGLYEDPHPRSVVRFLDDSIPVLLLPFRIETVFVPGERAPELWVRVFPDEIAVQTHEDVLTAAEQEAGRAYWVGMVIAAFLRSERERRRRESWRSLVELLSGPRAAWVAGRTRPADWDALATGGEAQTLVTLLNSANPELFDALRLLAVDEVVRSELERAIEEADGDRFIRLVEAQKWGLRLNHAVRALVTGFPEAELTKTDSWTRAPRTRVMPDRFVLLLYRSAEGPPRELVGEVVPDLVTIGPDPLDAKNMFKEEAGALKFGDAFAWMSDFEKAVEQGLGFRVPLSPEEARDGFAKVEVLGVKASAGADAGAALLEELIDGHQFSPKGFSIVRQGTPTNNTERDGSGYSDNDPYDDLGFFIDTDEPAFDPSHPDRRRSQPDGRQLADALGISYEPLLTVRNANSADLLEAKAMNVALFPATLGYWLRTWMAPVATPDMARLTRGFFNAFVTGRGPLPAIRIGDQPYGILVTSDLSRWDYPERPGALRFLLSDEETPFLRKLHALLVKLERIWSAASAGLPFAGRPGVDPSDLLMNVLGLHPTSVEYFQRIGYSSDYLRNLDSFKDDGRYANELESLMSSMPPTARIYLAGLGIQADVPDIAAMKSLHVLWQHYTTGLDAPNLVERRPPSETEHLTFNYIDKLASASGFDQILNEELGGPAPTSLLYLMLRNALLLQLHRGSYDWLEQRASFEPELVAALKDTSLPNVSATAPSLSKVELMSAKVGAIEPDHVLASTTVADFIWRGQETGDVEALYTAEQKQALGLLAGATTAALERAFVEHLDCCQYRLDAWETGLFAQRLMADRRAGSDDRRTGIYLGGFGWLEHVTPSAKTFIRREDLPETLRPEDEQPIIEEDEVAGRGDGPPGSRRGGFIHAPSLNHAAAAALLRNAYLSHADPARAEVYSVNLTSERVRRAAFILDGMRQGQAIEALLGYQFERGLHDRTSASAAHGDVPLLELNQFILPYRTAFPFEAREIPQAGDEAAGDKATLYGVVDGMRLAAADLSPAAGYGISQVLPPGQLPDAAQGAAILAEREALRDTLDAVKDLLMAENAYQLVQGNFDRVAAVSLAQKDARVPAALQVIDTPRGTELGFTNRVTIHFDDLDPTLEEANPWPGTSMTPRALAEPGLNRWLAGLLGAMPEKIVCEASLDGGAGKQAINLVDLGLHPVDFVWLASSLGDDPRGASELESRIAHEYRRARAVGDDTLVRIGFSPEVGNGELAFGQLFPLARELRALLSESRPLDARDFLPAPGGQEAAATVDTDNEEAFDLPELRARAESTFAASSALADVLDGPAAPSVSLVLLNQTGEPADDESFSGQLGQAFARLEEAKLDFTDVDRLSVSVLSSDVAKVAKTLRAIAGFGLADAFPAEVDLGDAPARAVLARAHRIARRLRNAAGDGILDRAAGLFAAAGPPTTIRAQARLLLEAASLLFGGTFRLLPAFTCHNEGDLALAAATRGQLLEHAASSRGITDTEVVDEWLAGLACVRPKIRRWETVRALADALGGSTLEVLPVQVPHRAMDSWLAVEFPAADPADPSVPFGIERDTLSIAAQGASAFQIGARQRAILVDDWTEEIPTTSETTGISFRFNQPNAAPPQALLLAVSPRRDGSWAWDDLVGTLGDTLERARRRAVEPAHLEKQGLVWNAFAPALVSEFSALRQSDVSLDLALMKDFQALTDFYSLEREG